MFTEVVNICYKSGKLFSLTLIFIMSPEIKKTMSFTETMKFLSFRQHFVIWAQASVYEKKIISR